MIGPRVRYSPAPGGARIAYTTLGEGPAVVCVPPLPLSHLAAGWRVPGVRRWFELLAESAEVIVFDALGSGLSSREQPDFSLGAVGAQLRALTIRTFAQWVAPDASVRRAKPVASRSAPRGIFTRLVSRVGRT